MVLFSLNLFPDMEYSMFTDRPEFNKTTIILWAAAFAMLFLAGRVNFPFFHIIVELFSIVVASGIFILSWHSRRLHENGFFTFLGISSLAVAIVDLLHTLTYKGMGVMPLSGAPVATQLWIAGRFLQAASTLLAFYFLRRRVKDTPLVAGFISITAFIIASIFVWRIFPDCYVEGSGLTRFKILSEYLIILLFAGSLFLLRREWKSFDPFVARLLAASFGFFIASELTFTHYVNVFGPANQLGHLFKVAGFFCLYRGVIMTGLIRPYDLLFRELKELTRTLEERVDEEVAKNREKDSLLVQQDRQAAMGEMIGNIAHQWRQPLNAVSVIVQDLAIRADSDELTREYLEESASRVVELTKHMSQTINDFRDFFRPDKEMVTFSLREVIWKSLTLVEGSFREQCISLEVSAEEDVLGVGYPNQFAQVVLNILNNSRDALVERKAPNPRIMIEVSRKCERSLVTIRDNAGGIPADIIHRVFDPYFTTKKEGTGIGLFMSRHIIERNMSGTLTVRNEEEGAAFSLVL